MCPDWISLSAMRANTACGRIVWIAPCCRRYTSNPDKMLWLRHDITVSIQQLRVSRSISNIWHDIEAKDASSDDQFWLSLSIPNLEAESGVVCSVKDCSRILFCSKISVDHHGTIFVMRETKHVCPPTCLWIWSIILSSPLVFLRQLVISSSICFFAVRRPSIIRR